MRRPGGDRGTTLVELTLALSVVLAVFAGALAAVGTTVSHWRLDQAVCDVSASLRAARAQALVRGEEVAIPFDLPGRRYTVIPVQPSGAPFKSWVVRLPPGVRYVAPGASDDPPVTLVHPTTGEPLALFSPRGFLLSGSKPGYVHLGVPERSLYRRLRVGAVGTVTSERWNGQKWE